MLGEKRTLKLVGLFACTMGLTACMSGGVGQFGANSPSQYSKDIQGVKADLDRASEFKQARAKKILAQAQMNKTVNVPTIRGLGYSQVSKQPGGSLNQRRLMAIRAARLEAMRDLVEQVHGIQVTSETNIRDAVVTDDKLRGLVAGELRGARTVHIRPKDSDTFEVVLELDRATVAYITRAARMGL